VLLEPHFFNKLLRSRSSLERLLDRLFRATLVEVSLYCFFSGSLPDHSLFSFTLTEEDWDVDCDDLLDAGGHEFSIFDKLKDATVCVMKFDPEYRDMVLQMNLPVSLKDELKRKSRVKKRKRKLSEDENS
jgi:hypothetical protein